MISRDVDAARAANYDLVIVGGGIFGIATALESVTRGLRPLLFEQADFGEATSAKTLRIIHGGLRYLQNMDLRRFRRSVEQRRWWLKTFPELVRPLPCLLPLNGEGLYRPSIFRLACAANDLLSVDRNRGLVDEQRIPSSIVLNRTDTLELFPGCRQTDLVGSAHWHDASMDRPNRLMTEMLRWVVSGGGAVLNYCSARSLREVGSRVTGVEAVDELTGEVFAVDAPVVVNTAGPWSRDVATDFDRDHPRLFRPSLAFNVLLRTRLPSHLAVAVSPPLRNAPTYFLRPFADRTFAGTFHAPWDGPITSDPQPAPEQLDTFLQDLAETVPDFAPSREDVLRVVAGLLPATKDGGSDVARHPVFVDHGSNGGPSGLISVSGVKFTTAPAVARTLLNRVEALPDQGFRSKRRPDLDRPAARAVPDAVNLKELQRPDPPEELVRQIRSIVREEAVFFVDDLVERRLDWGLHVEDLDAAVQTVSEYVPELPRRNPEPLTQRPGLAPGDRSLPAADSR